MRYYIVDDSQEFIDAIKLYLETELGAEVIGIANDGKEALEDASIYHADIILMDIIMKHVDGITTTNLLTSGGHPFKILAVTNSRDYITKLNLIQTGFKGCIYKNSAFEELPLAISRLKEGGLYFSKGIVIEKS